MGMERVQQYRRVRAGFTLIELMIVIGIIVLLMALCFSFVGKSWKVAHRVNCMSNMHQVSVGYFAYAAAYDGQLPDCDLDALVTGKSTDTLVDFPFLREFLSDPRVFHCPEDTRGNYRSYSVNDYLGGEWTAITHVKQLGRVVNQPATIMLIEEVVPIDRAATSGGFIVLGAPALVWAHIPGVLHDAGTCICMVDGHVEYWRWEDDRTLHLPSTPYPRTPKNPDLMKLQVYAGSVNATLN